MENASCVSEDGQRSVPWASRTKALTSQPRDPDAVYGIRKNPQSEAAMQRILPF
jgi:hypothetical protein